MNILELDSFNLADAVKFHDRLNHRLWDRGEHLHPEVHAKLMEIARDFQEFLGVPDLDVKDITISGSNAAYNYTPSSDIDLHLVVDLPEADHSEVYRELFDAKKFQYNAQHKIKIGGYDVELYVQNPNQEHHSQGIYSLLRNAWVSVPRRRKAEIDDISTRSKYEDLAARIDDVVRSGNRERMASMMKKIKTMRQTGLEQQGEFSADNLAFKMLRNNGYIKRLVDARNAARDRELSLAELARPKQRVQYGFMSESPDGVNPTTKMFLEQPEDENEFTVREFIDFVVDRLGITELPEIVLHNDPDWSKQNKSFGRYTPETHTLEVNLANRHIMDVLRTTAHELVHCKQNHEHALPDHAGRTGSDWENQANAMAGVIMRDYAEHNPKMFENASGYIPKNKKEARDPRYSMAVSVDVGPGQVGKEANKLALNTGRNGEPGLLMKSANLRESRMPQPSQGPGKYRDLNAPLGPESPPKMPAGTIKVDVSDTQDWYQLGQDISNLEIANKDHYNQGPPHTVLAFGSEELEHMYSKQLKRLGLPTHDLDEPGEEDEDLDEDLIAESIDDMLFEINMGSKNLRREAAKTGAIAGMEFEMIVPNVEGGGGDEDLEPDYDYDQRCRSIQDAYDFFYDGDWNSRRSCDEMRDSMRNDYTEWLDQKISDEWDSQGEEYIYQWVKENVDESEWNPEDKSDLGRTEALEEYATNVHADPVSDQYQTAYEEFREENQENWDESDWLDDADLSNMIEIERTYSMDWPHWSSPESGGEAEISDVAQEFENAIGRDVRASDNYHSGSTLRPSVANQRYIVEPDGSLEADNPGDRGLEFVSPPLPIDEILSDLNKVRAWAKEYGCYTNDSTGLHINISVPDYSRENLDFVKLALLMGDKYVLDAFGRTGNTYAKSAMGIIKDAVRNKPEDAARLLDKMKGNLDQLATKAIHSGITSKYTSINTKDGHIEFRSPGGDWLGDNFDQIENTLLRFTVAMSAALNPDAYRQEYLTKLYKMLTEDNKGDDTIKYFADYVAGKIPKAALRSFVKQAQLQRNIRRGKTDGKKMWWKVYKDGKNAGRYSATVEVVATSEKEAIDKAAKEWGEPLLVNTLARMDAEVLRPYEDKPGSGTYELFDRRTNETIPDTEFSSRNDADVQTRLDDYINHGQHGMSTVDARLLFGARPVGQPAGPSLNNRPSNPDGNYVIVDGANEQTPVFRYMASDGNDALLVLRQWISANPGTQWNFKFDPNKIMGQPGGSADADQGDSTNPLRPTGPGPWEIYNRQTGNHMVNLVQGGQPITDRGAAQRQAMALISTGRHDLYGVRTRGTSGTPNLGTQTDMENRLGLPSQSADANYAVVDRETLDPVFRFRADDRRDANRIYGEWLAAAGLPSTTEDFGFQEIRPQIPEVPLDIEQNFPDRTDGRNIDYSFRDLFGNTDQASSAPAGNSFSGQWKVMIDGEEVWRFRGVGNNQGDANRIAQTWIQDQRGQGSLSPAPGADIEVLPVMI
jgi:hypothetical protein